MRLIIELLSEHLLSTSFDDIDLKQKKFEADQHLSLIIFHSCFYEMLPLMFYYHHDNENSSLLTTLLNLVYEGSVLDPIENLHLMKIVTLDKTCLPICNIISQGCLEILFHITEANYSLFPLSPTEDQSKI
jgi:hypothetical protein